MSFIWIICKLFLQPYVHASSHFLLESVCSLRCNDITELQVQFVTYSIKLSKCQKLCHFQYSMSYQSMKNLFELCSRKCISVRCFLWFIRTYFMGHIKTHIIHFLIQMRQMMIYMGAITSISRWEIKETILIYHILPG